jgi:DNA-binding CsgD family transcriptional regulator
MPNFDTSWFPVWVFEVATPLWITDPAGNLSFWNDQAHEFFGIHPQDAIGHPCHERIAAVDTNGADFCMRRCRIRMQAPKRSGFGPYRVSVMGASHRAHEIQLVVLKLRAPDASAPWLCHIALDARQSTSISEYVNRVAKRSHGTMDPHRLLETSALSTREAEVLRLLSEDRSLKEAAFDLSVSYETVRNHAKNIRRKLGVHSTHEAVVCYLLSVP